MDTNLPELDLSAPFDRHRARVLPEWIDYNGHMNVAFYLYAFDQATETLCVALGCAADYVARKQGMWFTLETHVTYEREVAVGDKLRITSQILGWDAKRLHFFHQMYHAEQGYLAATNEQIMLHVSYESRRAAPCAQPVIARIAAMAQAHGALPRPDKAGRTISLTRK